MNFLKYLIFSIIGLLAFLLILALFIPKKYTVSVSENIGRPKQMVYDYMKLLKNQEYYSEWIKADPNLRPEISGEDGTVGANQEWNSKINDVGEGSQAISAMTEDRIDMDLNFIRPMKGVAKAANIFTSIDERNTKVTSEFYDNTAYPFNLMSYFFGRKMVRDGMRKNLANVKKLLETKDMPGTPIANPDYKPDEEKKYDKEGEKKVSY
ncbi:MAG: SRPBCC family protein [Saprospiraceae bacterium]|nr:SRPBCC family protein [Saprospiraceae bacterium]